MSDNVIILIETKKNKTLSKNFKLEIPEYG